MNLFTHRHIYRRVLTNNLPEKLVECHPRVTCHRVTDQYSIQWGGGNTLCYVMLCT